jgi:hypothetical protein
MLSANVIQALSKVLKLALIQDSYEAPRLCFAKVARNYTKLG